MACVIVTSLLINTRVQVSLDVFFQSRKSKIHEQIDILICSLASTDLEVSLPLSLRSLSFLSYYESVIVCVNSHFERCWQVREIVLWVLFSLFQNCKGADQQEMAHVIWDGLSSLQQLLGKESGMKLTKQWPLDFILGTSYLQHFLFSSLPILGYLHSVALLLDLSASFFIRGYVMFLLNFILSGLYPDPKAVKQAKARSKIRKEFATVGLSKFLASSSEVSINLVPLLILQMTIAI